MATPKDPSMNTPGRKSGRGDETGGTGAFAPTQTGGKSDGTSSAKPQVVTGQQDASFDSGSDREKRN